MNKLTELALSFFDVIEAEGREFSRGASRLIRSALFLFFGLAFLFAASLTAGYALYLLLSLFIGAPSAAFVVALLLCAAGVMLLRSASPEDNRKMEEPGPAPETPEESESDAEKPVE
ncbi:MAG: phage holin family protein [Synergistes sp.]|nr:phage holin family protein [Synergistes sp.]